MKNQDIFLTILNRNKKALLNAVKGLSDTEMFLTLPGNSNCINWIIGHIASYRDGMLVDSGLKKYMDTNEIAIYAGGSNPITPTDTHVKNSRLVGIIETTFEDLTTLLNQQQDVLKQNPLGNKKDNIGYAGVCNSLSEHFSQNLGHESIHIGELNPLRELALNRRNKI